MHDYILKMFHIRKIKGECQIFEAVKTESRANN